MERPIFQPVGTPVLELDTPALVVDLAALDKNIAAVHAPFRQGAVKLRPHVSCHQCPQIARRQLAAGSANGISVSSVGEAEVFAAAGFGDILITSPVATRAKIRRLCALANDAGIGVVADDPQNVALLSQEARAAGVTLNVLVAVDAGGQSYGAASGEPTVELAKRAAQAPGLAFRGLLAVEGSLRIPDATARAAETRRRLQPVLETRSQLEQAGLNVATISVGGTANYDAAAQLSGVTEIHAGSYALLDASLRPLRPELAPAARVLATIISHPVPHLAVADAGHKTLAPDTGLAALDGAAPGAQAVRMSAEHCAIELTGAAQQGFQPNDKVWLVPHDLALCFNQFDFVRAVQDGKLVGYWPIAARGRLD